MESQFNVASRWFDDFAKSLPEQKGKVFAITGTTSGTGFVAAETIGRLGAEKVFLLNRPSSRADEALEKLEEANPEANYVPIACDLADFASVRRAIEDVKAEISELDVLANNAGVMGLEDVATVDGYDIQVQVNHLSHFLLAQGLFPLLEAAAEARGEARIVNHSSEARHGKPLQERYFRKNGGNLGGNSAGPLGIFGGQRFKRYQQTKLANLQFTIALRNKLNEAGSKVKATVCHPGASSTNLANPVLASSWGGRMTQGLMKIAGFVIQSAEDGSIGLIKCMAEDDIENGDFYGPGGWVPIVGNAVKIPFSKKEEDPEQLKELWKWSEEAIETSFEFEI